MALAKTRRLPYLRRESLKRLALAYDLEPDGDYHKPGNSASERAFHLVQCGFDLTVSLFKSGFPTVDRRTQRRSAKFGLDNLIYGYRVAVLAGYCLPWLMMNTDGRLLDMDDDEGVVGREHHEALLRSIAEFFPLSGKQATSFQMFPDEFKVLETHEPRDRVAERAATGTRYSEALMRGENPDDDPELVREQWEYARDWFINQASIRVLRELMGADFGLLKDKVFILGRQSGPKTGELRRKQLNAWIEGSRVYREYALIHSAERESKPELA
jgi:hypothetical protein